MDSSVFWDIVLFSPAPACFMQVPCLAEEALCSSETSVAFRRTTWRYIPEDISLHINKGFPLFGKRRALHNEKRVRLHGSPPSSVRMAKPRRIQWD
jgi:hypothetical protein